MNDTKTIHLVSSRPRKDTQLQISPTDTASNILTRAGLDPSEYFIIKPGDQTEFGMDENVFPTVSEGGKLNVVPQSNVGGAITRPLTSYAQDHGWRMHKSWTGTATYQGYFRARGLRWPGRIREAAWGGGLEFEIENPPLAYIRHSPWAGCFHALHGRWMWISFARIPRDVDSGIAAVNKILDQVFSYRNTISR